MRIQDFDGTLESDDIEAVIERIRNKRRARYGAFHICAREEYPYLALHLNGDVAYLHYFPSDGHPGFQPTVPDGTDVVADVHFLNLDGTESGAFDMPRSTLISVDDAVTAVREFARDSEPPPSIEWFEL